VSLLIFVAASIEADARPFRLQQVPNGSNFGCTLCHSSVGGDALNPFGADVLATLTPPSVPISSRDVDWAAIFQLDSDGDGYTNGEELSDPDGDGEPDPALDPSHPGDPLSFPAPDVTLTIEDSPDPALAGGTVTYAVNVFNLGSRAAPDVVLELALEGDASVAELDLFCDPVDDAGPLEFVCRLGELPPSFGEPLELRFAVGLAARDPLRLSAVVSTSALESDPNDNTDVEETAVTPVDTRALFYRGDPNGDGVEDLSDAVSIFAFLFLGGEEPSCVESADPNNDANVDISDGIYLLADLFLGGPDPVAPGGPGQGQPCGEDTDAPGSAGDLGCEAYSHCGE
jgi:hypothetical protein